jgi:hypothetical protein
MAGCDENGAESSVSSKRLSPDFVTVDFSRHIQQQGDSDNLATGWL